MARKGQGTTSCQRDLMIYIYIYKKRERERERARERERVITEKKLHKR